MITKNADYTTNQTGSMIFKSLQSQMNQKHCSIVKSSETLIFTIISYGSGFRLYDTVIKMTFFKCQRKRLKFFAQVIKLLENEKSPYLMSSGHGTW